MFKGYDNLSIKEQFWVDLLKEAGDTQDKHLTTQVNINEQANKSTDEEQRIKKWKEDLGNLDNTDILKELWQ